MDFTVWPGSRIAKLPITLRRPALIVRNLLARNPAPPVPDPFRYRGDGLATDHHHFVPFEEDPVFNGLFHRMVKPWLGVEQDLRWRLWILTRFARQAVNLDGSFAEFGAFRGGCAFMILSSCNLVPGRHMFLFDTFAGIPASNLTESERAKGFAGRLSNTSLEYITGFLSEWRSFLVFVQGDVFETLPETETGALSFCHIDLNATAPTVAALEYAYPRLVPGGIVVFDDYGFLEYDEQRRAIDQFFSDKNEKPLALPTGQAVVIRL